MADKKNITIAVLGAAMVSILASAEAAQSPLLAPLQDFKGDLDSFSTDVTAQIQAYANEAATAKLQLSQFTDAAQEREQEANEVISELKKKVAELIEEKKSVTKVRSIEIDGVAYQVNHGAAGIGTADELAADEAKARKVLAKKGQLALTSLA